MERLAAVLPRPGRLARPRLPHRLVAALVAAAVVLGGGWFWVRDSGLVEIRTVELSGVSSSEGPQVRSALEAAARGMTTLHVREDDLHDAVRSFASVAGLRVESDFPHTLRIEVLEREPVAAVKVGSQYVPVGAGGRLMRGVRPKPSLPTISANRFAPGDVISDRRALGAVDVLAGAPAPIRARIRRAFSGPRGLALEMRDGPALIFGSPRDLERKWLAAARVLADASAAGAVYLDLRLPERVAAGGLGPVQDTPQDSLSLTPEAGNPNPQPQP